jgi:hypothetical protein
VPKCLLGIQLNNLLFNTLELLSLPQGNAYLHSFSACEEAAFLWKTYILADALSFLLIPKLNEELLSLQPHYRISTKKLMSVSSRW